MVPAEETKGATRRRLRARRRRIAASRDLDADGQAIADAVGRALRGAHAERGTRSVAPVAEVRGRQRPSLEAQDTAFVAPQGPGAAPQGTILSYESLPHEPPTAALNTALLAAGHRVLVPITLADWRLDWCDPTDPERSPLGVDSPAAADAAIVPALAVDTTGTRLGQGGGCYDRVLPMLRPGTPVLVLLHPGEHTGETLPRDAHDVPVTTVVTAAGLARASAPLRP